MINIKGVYIMYKEIVISSLTKLLQYQECKYEDNVFYKFLNLNIHLIKLRNPSLLFTTSTIKTFIWITLGKWA